MFHVQLREAGSDEWLEFTERPVSEVKARRMCVDIERAYGGIEARTVELESPFASAG